MRSLSWPDPWRPDGGLGHWLAHHEGRPAADLLDLISFLTLLLMVAGSVVSVLSLVALEMERLL
jgi:hypothetical protein